MGVFLLELYLGLALHMTGTDPEFEGQLLAQEVIDRALLPSSNRSSPNWFVTVLRDTLSWASFPLSSKTSATLTADNVTQAAMQMAVEEVPSAISFRKLAARAGTSVSAVAHYFPTCDQLLFASYREIHEQIISFTSSLVPETQPIYSPELAEKIASYNAEGAVSLLVAYSEFELVAARAPEFRPVARYIRMTRGLFHTFRQDPGFDPFGIVAFDSYALSFWMAGHELRMAWQRATGNTQPDQKAIEFGFKQFGVS